MGAKCKFMMVGCSLLLVACALTPNDRTGGQSFVSVRELDTVELAQQAMSMFNKGRFIDAELYFRQALYLTPDAANLQLNLAAALERSGSYDESEQIYKKLMKSSSDDLKVRLGYARLLVSALRFDEALENYEQIRIRAAARGDVESAAAATRSMATLSYRIGREADAQCQLRLALTYRANLEDTSALLDVMLGRGFYTEAQLIAEGFAAEHNVTKDPLILWARGRALFGTSNFALARDVAQAGLAIPGANPAILNRLRFLFHVSTFMLTKPNLAALPNEILSEGDDAHVDLRKALLGVKDLNAVATLYWPANLVSVYHTLLEVSGMTKPPSAPISQDTQSVS